MRTDLRRSAPALALTATLLTGCTNDDDSAMTLPSPSPTAPSPSPTAAPTAISTAGPVTQWETCLSTRAGLTVSHPPGWTVRDHPGGGCAYFDPEPFEVERGTEAPSVAVRLDVESVEYDRVRASYLRGDVLSQREVEVARYPGIRIEDQHDGGPLGPLGRRLTYLADLDQGTTLVLTTNETHAGDPAEAREVVDEMAERLRGPA